MKMNDLATVRAIANERSELVGMLKRAQAGAVVLKIGTSVGLDIEAALRPALITELTKRIEALDKMLTDLGVTIDPEPEPAAEPAEAKPTAKVSLKKGQDGPIEADPPSKV